MKIAIWGTGKFGKYIYEQIKNRKDDSIVAWIDNDLSIVGTKIESILVISPQEAQTRIENDIEMILVAFIDSVNIYDEINNASEYRYGFIKNIVYRGKLQLDKNLLSDRNILWSWHNTDLYKPKLQHLETNIVDYCNLNCKGCSHFSNLFNMGDQVPYETFCKDLEMLSQKVFVEKLYLLGGEALLNCQITEYIQVARKLLPYTEIELVTNGIMIPNQTDVFFQCCVENDISISISGYKPTLKIKDNIQETLEKWDVVYYFRTDVSDFGKNIDLSGEADKNVAVTRCRENQCHFFRYGKLYKCPFEALANNFFSHYGIDIHFDGGINIYDEDVDWEDVVRRLRDEPVDSCRYCGVEEKIEWRVENNPQIEDWIVN